MSSGSTSSASVNYASSLDIGGFEFTVSGATLTGVSSDLGEVSFNAANGKVLGFDFGGGFLAAGSGSLATLEFTESSDGHSLSVSDVVLSSPSGSVLVTGDVTGRGVAACDDVDDDDLCDATDDCVGAYDNCGVCNGSGVDADN